MAVRKWIDESIDGFEMRLVIYRSHQGSRPGLGSNHLFRPEDRNKSSGTANDLERRKRRGKTKLVMDCSISILSVIAETTP